MSSLLTSFIEKNLNKNLHVRKRMKEIVFLASVLHIKNSPKKYLTQISHIYSINKNMDGKKQRKLTSRLCKVKFIATIVLINKFVCTPCRAHTSCSRALPLLTQYDIDFRYQFQLFY